MLIVDASVVMKLLTREGGSTIAIDRVSRAQERTAPDWIQAEIASALAKKVRYAGLPIETAREAFAALPLILPDLAPTAPLLASAIELSVELSHALYDCLYLALALQTGGKLLTADHKFVTVVSLSQYHRQVELLE
ncbi:type II toxin-antitoxin system VapC family toxin [Sphingomonas sp.]|uniref:type II toxin-antitoxin system VapC family toxin n=1 Tax=Sphingomonas sp. TaxID=28214 RepID=UPI0035A8F82A